MALTTHPASRSPVWQRLRASLCLIACLASAEPQQAAAQGLTPKEYQLKAVFLFNFAMFVEWPASSFEAPDAPMVICVLGDDPFGDYLDETVKGETVNSHALTVQRFHRVEDVVGCHILFIAGSEASHLEQVFDSVKNRSVLTVGDADRFAGRGGMIRFVTDNNRIRLRINLAVAEAADLKISSKLLRPAEIVSTGKE